MSNGIELMQHALGINERNRTPYRNYFLAGEGHTDNEMWEKLVSEGFATSRPAPDFVGGGVLYHVTDKGEELAMTSLPEPKKKTRYEEYLDACRSVNGCWVTSFPKSNMTVMENAGCSDVHTMQLMATRVVMYRANGAQQRKQPKPVTKRRCVSQNRSVQHD